MSSESEENIQRRFFGRGLEIANVAPDSIGLDLVWRDSGDGLDLAIKEGGANLAQDLQVALLTATGTDLFNVTFGFDGLRVLTDEMTPNMTAEMLRLSVMKTMSLDARIKRVVDVTLTETEPGSRHWVVETEVQTVLGDVLKLTLGGVNGR